MKKYNSLIALSLLVSFFWGMGLQAAAKPIGAESDDLRPSIVETIIPSEQSFLASYIAQSEMARDLLCFFSSSAHSIHFPSVPPSLVPMVQQYLLTHSVPNASNMLPANNYAQNLLWQSLISHKSMIFHTYTQPVFSTNPFSNYQTIGNTDPIFAQFPILHDIIIQGPHEDLGYKQLTPMYIIKNATSSPAQYAFSHNNSHVRYAVAIAKHAPSFLHRRRANLTVLTIDAYGQIQQKEHVVSGGNVFHEICSEIADSRIGRKLGSFGGDLMKYYLE